MLCVKCHQLVSHEICIIAIASLISVAFEILLNIFSDFSLLETATVPSLKRLPQPRNGSLFSNCSGYLFKSHPAAAALGTA